MTASAFRGTTLNVARVDKAGAGSIGSGSPPSVPRDESSGPSTPLVKSGFEPGSLYVGAARSNPFSNELPKSLRTPEDDPHAPVAPADRLAWMHWNLKGQTLPGPDVDGTAWLGATADAVPDVVTLAGVEDPSALAAFHRAQLAPLGFRLAGSGETATLIRRPPAESPGAWTTSEGLQVQRDVFRFGDRRLALFAFDLPPSAKPGKLMQKVEDLIQAHRLLHPDDQIIMATELPQSFDEATLGKKGLGAKVQPEQLRSPTHWFVAASDGLGKSPNTLRHGWKLAGGDASRQTAGILLDPSFFDPSGIRFERRSYSGGSTNGPVSFELTWTHPDDLPRPRPKRLVAPGVKVSDPPEGPKSSDEATSVSPRPTRDPIGRVPAFDPQVPQEGQVAFRVPVQLNRRIKEEIRNQIADSAHTGMDVDQAVDQRIARLGYEVIQGNEVPPLEWNDLKDLSPLDLLDRLKQGLNRTRRLGYERASRVLLHDLYNAGGRVTDDFTGKTFEHPSDRPAIRPEKLTVEHIWARHNGSRVAMAQDDLHILVPMEAETNSRRSNYAYLDLKPGDAVVWEANGNRLAHRPHGKGVQEVFEPNAKMKGRIGRAMLYAALLYGHELTREQASTYLRWHQAHPPTDAERELNSKISVLQGNRNPFVDVPEAAGPIAPYLPLAKK